MSEKRSLAEDYAAYIERMQKRSNKRTAVEERNIAYARMLDTKSIQSIILLQSNDGFSAEGSVRSLYRRMSKQEQWRAYKFVWVVKNKNIYEKWKATDKEITKCKCICMGSEDYLEHLASASVIVSDTRMPAYYIPREGQRYIKADDYFVNANQGYGLGVPYLDSIAMQEKDYLSATDILSGSSFYTQKVLKDRWLLDGVYEGKVHEGYAPRWIDLAGKDTKLAKRELAYLGVEEGKRLLVCNFGIQDTFSAYIGRIIKLAECLEQENIQVMMKVPVKDFRSASGKLDGSKVILAKNFTNTSTVLAAADYLVGDQGKYTYDYLATQGILMFWDAKGKELLVKEELPGVIVKKIDDIVNVIKGQYDSKAYQEAKNRWCDYLNIPSAESQATEKRTECSLKDDRQQVLVFAPRALQEDVLYLEWREQALAFIHALDVTRYNVTVLTPKPRENDTANWLAETDIGKLRVLYRAGVNVQQMEAYYRAKYIANNMLYTDELDAMIPYIDGIDIAREMCRCCGKLRIDTAVYFGQMDVNLFTLLYKTPCRRKIIFDTLNYNQIDPDGENLISIRGKNVIRMYQYCDKIVHTSQYALQSIESRGLLEEKEKHIVFSPVPDFEVMEHLGDNKEVVFAGQDALLCDSKVKDNGSISGVILSGYRREKYHIAVPVNEYTILDYQSIVKWYHKTVTERKEVQIYVFDPLGRWKDCLNGRRVDEQDEDTWVCAQSQCDERVLSAFDEVVLFEDIVEEQEGRYYYLCSLLGKRYSDGYGMPIPTCRASEVRNKMNDKCAKLFS